MWRRVTKGYWQVGTTSKRGHLLCPYCGEEKPVGRIWGISGGLLPADHPITSCEVCGQPVLLEKEKKSHESQ